MELRELLEPEIIAEVHAQLQRTDATRRPQTSEQVADMLRVIGPIPVDNLGEHTDVPLQTLHQQLGHRIMEVRIGGRVHLAQSQDAALLRDGLGIPVPPGIPAQVETITDALDQLVSRWARTRGPFVLRELADALGGELACTRPLVEAGWLDAKHQIGLSGRTVRPKLIITCGVSGAIQFVAGMNHSDTIFAINTDPKASIFKAANYAVIGDLYEIVPQLLAGIRAGKGKRG